MKPEEWHLQLLAPLAGHSSRRDYPGLVRVSPGLAGNGAAHARISGSASSSLAELSRRKEVGTMSFILAAYELKAIARQSCATVRCVRGEA